MMARVLDVLSDIASEGTYGSREEWLNKFERTQATNAPGLLFADAVKLGLLIPEIPGTWCFVYPEVGEGGQTDTSILDKQVSVFYSLAETRKRYGKRKDGGERDFNCFWSSTKTVREVCSLIQSGSFRQPTEELRLIPRDSTENSEYKKLQFSYVCFSGTFSYRADKNLIKHSNLICIDLDHLNEDLQRVRSIINAYHLTILSFISPNADGLKVVFEVDTKVRTQHQWYQLLSGRLEKMCGLPPKKKVDESCKDICRACFLPYDPFVYISPKVA